MSDLTEWLLACIAEDETVAKAAQENSTGGGRWWVDGPAEKSRKFWVYATGEKFAHVQIADHIARHDPAHVLAVCKAHRAIVEAAREYSPELEHGDNGEWAFDVTLRAIASIYADRPGWREEWAA